MKKENGGVQICQKQSMKFVKRRWASNEAKYGTLEYASITKRDIPTVLGNNLDELVNFCLVMEVVFSLQ